MEDWLLSRTQQLVDVSTSLLLMVDAVLIGLAIGVAFADKTSTAMCWSSGVYTEIESSDSCSIRLLCLPAPLPILRFSSELFSLGKGDVFGVGCIT